MSDRRSCPRWQVNCAAEVKLEDAGIAKSCTVYDLNLKGAKVRLSERLAQDSSLKLSLALTPECTFEVQVWVAWHRNVEGINIYGLYFSHIKDGDKEKIYKFLHQSFPGQAYKQTWQGLIKEEGGESMKDRRIFERFPARFPVNFLSPVEGKEGEALTQDISAKGVGLVSKDRLALRTPLEMWFQVPDNGEPLYTRGEVVWSREIGPERYTAGVELERADLMGVARLLRAI